MKSKVFFVDRCDGGLPRDNVERFGNTIIKDGKDRYSLSVNTLKHDIPNIHLTANKASSRLLETSLDSSWGIE